LKFQAVAEKTTKDARGLLYFATPGISASGSGRPAHMSLGPNCGSRKLNVILVLWHCWRYETNSSLILLVLG